MKVYSVARTVADCFRFRNTVGLDVALEALSEAWRGKRLDLDELNRIAKRLRVQRVMQPYLKRSSYESRRPQEHCRFDSGAARPEEPRARRRAAFKRRSSIDA